MRWDLAAFHVFRYLDATASARQGAEHWSQPAFLRAICCLMRQSNAGASIRRGSDSVRSMQSQTPEPDHAQLHCSNLTRRAERHPLVRKGSTGFEVTVIVWSHQTMKPGLRRLLALLARSVSKGSVIGRTVRVPFQITRIVRQLAECARWKQSRPSCTWKVTKQQRSYGMAWDLRNLPAFGPTIWDSLESIFTGTIEANRIWCHGDEIPDDSIQSLALHESTSLAAERSRW